MYETGSAVPFGKRKATKIDGTTQFQLVTRIMLPFAKPTIAVTAMMILVYVWNEYIFAINFMTGSDTYTLAAGLYSLQATEMSGSWSVFSAVSLVVSLPILIVFFALQKNVTMIPALKQMKNLRNWCSTATRRESGNLSGL